MLSVLLPFIAQPLERLAGALEVEAGAARRIALILRSVALYGPGARYFVPVEWVEENTDV